MNFKNLKTLILNKNRIKKIPIQLSNLISLRTFSLSNNELTEVPESIYTLPQLRKLNISSNNISKIEERLLCHKTLEYLWLNNLPINSFAIIDSFKHTELVKKM